MEELDSAIDGYLSFLGVERNLAKNTLEAYGRDLADFSKAIRNMAKALQPAEAAKAAQKRGLFKRG